GGSLAAPFSETYDPATEQWTIGENLLVGRRGHTGTLLADGRVLVAGGFVCCTRDERLTDELVVDAALGKVDYYEAAGFSDHLSTAAVWYRLLDCGLRLPAGAGTDAMANYASLRGPVGMNRVYVKAQGVLSRESFLAGLKAGRTFATNGPLVGLRVDKA